MSPAVPSETGILELLEARGLPMNVEVMAARHADKRFDLDMLERQGWIEVYQSYQRPRRFDKCSFLVSFIGLPGYRARFFGVYKVGEKSGAGTDKPMPALPSKFPYPNFVEDG